MSHDLSTLVFDSGHASSGGGVIAAIPARAEPPAEPPGPEVAAPQIPDDALNRGTPRPSLQGQLKAVPRDATSSRGSRPTTKEDLLLMQPVPRGDGVGIWKVSKRTVAQRLDLYNRFGYGPVADFRAERLPAGGVLGVEYFKSLLLLGAGKIVYAAFCVIGFLLARLLSAPGDQRHGTLRYFLAVPLAWFAAVVSMSAAIGFLGVGITAQEIMRGQTLVIATPTWVLVSGAGLVRVIHAGRPEQRGKTGAIVLLRPLANAIKVPVIIGTVLFTCIHSRPARVGDSGRVGAVLGTIEQIGLRSTRIRTLENAFLAVPGSTYAAEKIAHFSVRPRTGVHSFT